MSASAGGSAAAHSMAERWWTNLERWYPHLTLALSTPLALGAPGQGAGDRAVTAGLALAASVWVALAHTSAPAARREHGGAMAAYLAGLLVLASLLMLRNPIFLLFAITGFLHANLLRPRCLVFVGTGVTSFAIHAITWSGVPFRDPGALVMFVAIVVIQTFAIGAGIIGAERLTALSEERGATVAALEATLAENAGLHEQLVVQAREAGIRAERQRMAQEIHDTVAQGLAGVITQLEAAEQATGDAAARARHVAQAAAIARDSLGEARRSVLALRPGRLEEASLPDALADVARDWSDLHAVPVRASTDGPVRPLHPEIELTLLRVAQEALANVAKHAAASRVAMTLTFVGDTVTLDVRDDGVGFAPGDGGGGTRANGGFGLTGMRERLERLTGSLEIETAPGAGTAVSARVPAVAGDG